MGSLEPLSILDTPEGEIALLSALIQARPVGLQKHWAMLSILRTLEARLGEGRVTSEEAWGKLRSLYDLRLLDADVSSRHILLLNLSCVDDCTQAADLQAAEEAEAEVAAEGIGFFTFNTATTAARRRSRRSSLHERPHIERPEFNLVQRPSFQEEFEKRRRRSSPSPGANDDGHEPAGTKEMARSPSELSMLDDKDIVMPTNALEQKEEETLQVHLDDGEEEHKDSNNELVENAASPSRSARFTRSKQGTASERKHGYRKTRKLSPDKRIKGERSDEDLKLLKRQVDEEEEASSDAASTLSALSDGEEGGISNERYQHPDRMGSALGDIDIGEENEVTDEEGGADRLSNLDEDTETDRGSGPEDSPYKSPKSQSLP